MKILNLNEDSRLYTSNSYLILGSWNGIDDVNTLIDTGNDIRIVEKINAINTGLGKRKIDQVILTHSHSDHAGILLKIKELFKPLICAFNPYVKGIDFIISDRDLLKAGDRMLEVFHITMHSHDSICLYSKDDEILFSGDTSFPVKFENKALKVENETSVSRLAGKKISMVYPGHGPPQTFADQPFKILL